MKTKKPHKPTKLRYCAQKQTQIDRGVWEAQFGKNDGKRRKKTKSKGFLLFVYEPTKKKELFIFLSFFLFFYFLRSLWKSRQ